MDKPKENIVIVDDHQMIIDGIKSMLSSCNYKILKEAENGQAALDFIEYNYANVQLILTDISMPIMNGIELCKIIKQRYHHIGVLILSMYNNEEIVKEAIEAEADGYILKNSGKDELLLAMQKILNGGTYFSHDVFSIICNNINKGKKQAKEMSTLSVREVEVLKLILKENTSDEIANQLFISKKTVDNHRANLLEKTGCKTTIGLVKFAIRNNFEKL